MLETKFVGVITILVLFGHQHSLSFLHLCRPPALKSCHHHPKNVTDFEAQNDFDDNFLVLVTQFRYW